MNNVSNGGTPILPAFKYYPDSFQPVFSHFG